MARDPGRASGDGMKMAMRAGSGKGKPARPADPGRAKGDGIKEAMRAKSGKPSKLSPMGGAMKRER
ncbi:MAG: hypothetical protein B7Z66_15295 [Chromatiales bacterium 21-64-14]|nr:MAG: hypothetical protein B7Z66_15295 [Chromatiales bacterium 21-64-14]